MVTRSHTVHPHEPSRLNQPKGNMNTRHTLTLIASLTTLIWAGCSPKEDNAVPRTSAEAAADKVANSARDAAAATGDALTTTWENVKDATYDDRARLQASLDNLSKSVDAKVDELQARGATATGAASEAWKSGLSELREARTVLKTEISELGNATEATWARAKADVESAWERVRRISSELEARPATG